MSKGTYTRPKMERARMENPAREIGRRTDLEDEVIRIAKERITQERNSFTLVQHQYDAPFFYGNFRLELGRPWENARNHTHPDVPEEKWGQLTDEFRVDYTGAEFNPDGVELDVPPYGAITFVEEEPIVEVSVIGSACVPPGYVQLYGEPVEWKYWRTGVKMRADNLWGEHMRAYMAKLGIGDKYRDAGFSCAVFRTPPCSKITIMAGSQHIMDASDLKNMRHDAHYCIRHIYVGVQRSI